MSSSTKRNKFSFTDRKRTAFFIVLFAFGMFTCVILYPSTLISVKQILILSMLFLSIDILILRLKTNLKHLPAFIALSVSILLAQFALLLLLNRIPIDDYTEKHKIVGTEKHSYGLMLQLENDAYSDFFALRLSGSNNMMLSKDSVYYRFSDGLLGFKIVHEFETYP